MENKIIIDYGYEQFNIDKQYDCILIITDENVHKNQYDKFKQFIKQDNVKLVIVKSGEQSKSIDTYNEVIQKCIEENLSRKSLIIAFGGGVVGDLSGFVASTYMRGIDFIQVPTTLLSQVDSSVGGKTGINIGNIKNIIGTFYQPQLTYINVNSLKTLDEDEYISGIGEVIKYAFIYDYEFLNYINKNSERLLNKNEEVLYNVIKKCTDIKSDVVSKDEKESGLRKILNLGHTFGHGIEKLCNLKHGFAVNIGTNMAFLLSIEKGFIDEKYYEEFLNISKKLNLPTTVKYNNAKDILEIMKNDKKNSFGNINLVLPTELGKVDIYNDINDEKIIEVIKRCLDA